MRRGLILSLFSFFFFEATAFSMTIAEYVAEEEAQERAIYEEFKVNWFQYLEGREFKAPKETNAYDARRATEEFFILSGGVKAAFGRASQKNLYAFTFSRSEEESRKASFHRAKKSIYMDIHNMDANEWLIIFVHEVAHSLDSVLVDALDVYNQEETFKFIEEMAKKKSLKELSIQERYKLDEWLLAGLERGFLAEYRAWLLTYLIYEEGLEEGVFQKVDWLEALKENRPAGISLNTYIFRYLSQSWIDPTEHFFSSPVVKRALVELRDELYQDPSKVKLGQIGELIKQF